MLWPFEQPFKLTCLWLLAFIAVCTVTAPLYKAKRVKAFRNSIIISAVLFIPSCSMIKSELDAKRFGIFDYKTYSEVQDFRIERFLPPAATEITLKKYPIGHHAKYKISAEDFHNFVDGLWKRYGDRSAIRRENMDDESKPADGYLYEGNFKELGWAPLENAYMFHSPVEGDGGGAIYYFDADAGIAYHRAGYW